MWNVRRKLLITLIVIASAVAVPAISAHAEIRPQTITETDPNPDKRSGPNSGEPDVGQTTPNTSATAPADTEDLVEAFRGIMWWVSMQLSHLGF